MAKKLKKLYTKSVGHVFHLTHQIYPIRSGHAVVCLTESTATNRYRFQYN